MTNEPDIKRCLQTDALFEIRAVGDVEWLLKLVYWEVSMIGIGILGIVLIIAGIPLILRRVPKNDLYGLRTRATMEGSEENWYAQNRKAGWGLVLVGCSSVLLLVFLSLL